MVPERLQLARTLFKLRIYESNGYSFENLFASVMQYARPDLMKVKPYGNQGDRGNDAYEKEHGRYFQMYAPEDPSSSQQKAIAKVQKDFEAKLLPYWGAFCPVKEYLFVFNDKYSGTNFPLEKTLAEIKSKHSLKVAEVFLAKHLEQEFVSLSEDQILMVISGVPDPASLENLDYSIVGEVLRHIQNLTLSYVESGKLVVPNVEDKIEFNGLKVFGQWMQIKQRETWQIDEYFVRNSDFARATLRDYLSAYYAESIVRFPTDSEILQTELGDLRFAFILDRIAPETGVAAHDRARRDVALVIMAKYFETCDIFEEPTNVTTG